jgi:putative transposase
MPRISRAVAVGYPHHITQRGNYRQVVFEEKDDYVQYLKWLTEYCKRYFLKIWAYCLLSNHVHFIAVPLENNSLAKTFNTLHMRYAQYFNKKKEAKGHLWQGRFYSCILDERRLYAAIRYVENNPVRAKIVERPDEYQWSSARSHIYKEDNPVLWEIGGKVLNLDIKGLENGKKSTGYFLIKRKSI